MSDKKNEKVAKADSKKEETQIIEEKELTKEEKLQAQVDDLTDMLKRKQAEFENVRKRMETEQAEFRKHASDKVILNFVEILDHFSLALKHGVDEQGVKMIYGQFLDKLKQFGVEEVSCVGQVFDPNVAEAIMTRKEEDKEDNIVLDEMNKAYKIHGKLVKCAKVIVNKK